MTQIHEKRKRVCIVKGYVAAVMGPNTLCLQSNSCHTLACITFCFPVYCRDMTNEIAMCAGYENREDLIEICIQNGMHLDDRITLIYFAL